MKNFLKELNATLIEKISFYDVEVERKWGFNFFDLRTLNLKNITRNDKK